MARHFLVKSIQKKIELGINKGGKKKKLYQVNVLPQC
jgi:hypothetical protein